MSVVLFAAAGLGFKHSATALPSTASATRSGAGSATSGSSTVTVSGGSGAFSYSWACTGGITCDSASAATTTFSKSLSDGETASGTATCTITDRQNGNTATATVAVTLTSTATALGAAITPSSVWRSGMAPSSGPYDDVFSVSVTANGVGPYTYSWSVTSGLGATIIGSSTGTSCTFRYNAGPEASGYGTGIQCLVTDTANGHTATPVASIIQDPGH